MPKQKIPQYFNLIQLLSLVARDDEAAFNEIYKRHWVSIYRNAMKILKAENDADDVVQEVFSALWERRKTIAIKNTLAGYLFMTARYISLRIIEKNIEKYADARSIAEYYPNPMLADFDANFDVAKMEITIENAINSLPRKMKEIFDLSRKNLLTHKQIAEKLNISEGTVKKQIYNSLKIIKEQLGFKTSVIILLFYIYDIVF